MFNKQSVSKEDFKTYLTKCQKLAWFFSSKENFLEGIKLKQDKIFDFDASIDTSEESYGTSISFDIMDEFDFLFKDESELTDEEKIKNEALKAQFSDDNGFNVEVFKGKQIEDGMQTGALAQEYFELKLFRENKVNNENKKSINFEAEKMSEELTLKVEEALKDSNIKYLYEPAFYALDKVVKTRCDILVNKGNRHVEIVEVKATSSVKKEHIFDLFYQKKVLELCGYFVDNVYLLRLNKEYFPESKDGFADYDPKNQPEVFYDDFKELIEELRSSKEAEPVEDAEIDIDKMFVLDDRGANKANKELVTLKYSLDCLDNSIIFEDTINEILDMLQDKPRFKQRTCYKMGFKTKKGIWVEETKACPHVFKYIDAEHSVFELKSNTKVNNMQFIYDTGITDIKDIDNEMVDRHKEGFFKTPKIIEQLRVLIPYLKGKEFKVINPNSFYQVEDELKNYRKYPVYMYDFETSTWAIPKFKGSNTYQQIPFQYSIDILVDDNFDVQDKKSFKHFDFLSKIKTDPRIQFVRRFIIDCFAEGPGIYVAYNMSFEKGVIAKLIHRFPEYRMPLQFIYDNTIDLMNFFQRKKPSEDDTPCLVYHPDFHGSYSIKKTQPALYPGLSYKDLIVNKGDKTSELFRRFIDGETTEDVYRTTLFKEMLIYCNRDTEAMTALLQSIIELAKKEKPVWE